MSDIFEFWSRVKRGEHIHPADKEFFKRVSREEHGFALECLPSCFGGCLKTAPVVFLYHSPGFGEQDLEDARTERGRDEYIERYKGELPFSVGHQWFSSRTKDYADEEIARHKIATLNIGAYHSKM